MVSSSLFTLATRNLLSVSWPDFWIKNKWQTKALWPLSKLVCWEAQRRYRHYKKQLSPLNTNSSESSNSLRQSDATVIVVGNLVVGGTGKTPFIVWLVKHLVNQGFKVGLLSRGYGSKSTAWPVLVDKDSNPKEVGDEPVMLAQQTGCKVAVSPKRIEALALLQKDANYDFIISDDGLQHFALERDIEVVMIDAERQFGNGFCLPAGPMREPLNRIEDVDFTVWNGLPEQDVVPSVGFAQKSAFSMRLMPQTFHSLANPEITLSVTDFIEKYSVVGLYAVAGIGNPNRFFKTLKSLGLNIESTAFADHHDFKAEDFKDLLKDRDKPLVMTQKDAVKCAQFVTPNQNWWYLEVAPQCSPELLNTIIKKHQERLKQ